VVLLEEEEEDVVVVAPPPGMIDTTATWIWLPWRSNVPLIEAPCSALVSTEMAILPAASVSVEVLVDEVEEAVVVVVSPGSEVLL
jgi:hypothetical protein